MGRAWSNSNKVRKCISGQKEEKSPYELFYGSLPGYVRNLKVFGEMGVATNHENKGVRSKLEDHGRTCVFVGYASSHAGDVYRMFNPTTRKCLCQEM